MIEGIGTDIVEISRIEKLVKNDGGRFLDKVFTKKEIEYCLSKKNKYQHFAGKFAAKEAAVKALAECCQSGFNWKDVEILNKTNGAPEVKLYGKFAEYISDGKRIRVSISHEKKYAVAFAVLEKKQVGLKQ